ncbi:hypothetical protein FRC00_002943 [Tulasnella sp. 408]|nr:hypothetical protein FRC00_002943 [Tulasnella sp. 408]
MSAQRETPYAADHPYKMTRNESHTSSLEDDAPFGCDTKAAHHDRESYLQAPPPKSVHGDSQMFDYESSGQKSLALMSNWVPEDRDSMMTLVNPDTSSFPKQSPESRVQPAAIGFGKSNVQKNFVRKLFEALICLISMLSDESAKPYIYWDSDGKSFFIEKQEEFAKKVLKRHLKTENFQSFIRQLNMYDFHKINRAQRAQRGVQAQTPQFVFSHQKFQRDSPELLSEIKRKGAEPQDAPPSYENLSSVGKPLLGMPTSTQPLVTGQPELRDILIQMDFERLRSRNAFLEEEINNLKGERDALKASLQVRTTVSMPQVPQVPASSTATYQPLYGGNASNKALELNRASHLFEPDYSASPPEPTELPMLFTGIRPQNNISQAGVPSHFSLDSTPISIRRRLSNAPAPDMGTNNQPAPQQPREQGKARPSSWYENVGKWLGYFPGGRSHTEPGCSDPTNVLPQDTHATHALTFVSRETPSPRMSTMIWTSDNGVKKLIDDAESTHLQPGPGAWFSTKPPLPNITQCTQSTFQGHRGLSGDRQSPWNKNVGQWKLNHLPVAGSQCEPGTDGTVSLLEELISLSYVPTPATQQLVTLHQGLALAAMKMTRNKHKVYSILGRSKDICNYILAALESLTNSDESQLEPEAILEVMGRSNELIYAMEEILLELAILVPIELQSLGRTSFSSWPQSRTALIRIWNHLQEAPFDGGLQNIMIDMATVLAILLSEASLAEEEVNSSNNELREENRDWLLNALAEEPDAPYRAASQQLQHFTRGRQRNFGFAKEEDEDTKGLEMDLDEEYADERDRLIRGSAGRATTTHEKSVVGGRAQPVMMITEDQRY